MIHFLSSHHFSHKKVLLRVDFNVSLNKDATIADDTRVQQTLPTIKLLLKEQNKLIIVSHLGQPNKRDSRYSLKRVAKDLGRYLPSYHIRLIPDFLTEKSSFLKQKQSEILLLENIRFYPQEKANDKHFSQQLARLADVYVNDGFGVSHRSDASVVGIPNYLPSYAGLLMEKEITILDKIIHHPKHPLVAILGGAKISTKIKLINKLIKIADVILIGGAMANTFLAANGYKLGKSLVEAENVGLAKQLMVHAYACKTKLVIPIDAVVDTPSAHEVSLKQIKPGQSIMDIGAATQALFGKYILSAKTIIWNGPIGKCEDVRYERGTEFIYYAITQNDQAISVVGGGDTLAAIQKKEYLNKITHISTGGGAMLEYIEKGTLPGIDALKK